MSFWNRIFGRKEQQFKTNSVDDGSSDYPVPMFMRIDKNNHIEKSRQNNREMLNFHVTSEKLHEILAVCGELDAARSDFIRASIEFAMPVFRHHHELFEQFKNKSKEGW